MRKHCTAFHASLIPVGFDPFAPALLVRDMTLCTDLVVSLVAVLGQSEVQGRLLVKGIGARSPVVVGPVRSKTASCVSRPRSGVASDRSGFRTFATLGIHVSLVRGFSRTFPAQPRLLQGDMEKCLHVQDPIGDQNIRIKDPTGVDVDVVAGKRD